MSEPLTAAGLKVRLENNVAEAVESGFWDWADWCDTLDLLLASTASRAVDEALSVVKYQADRICVTFRGHKPPTCETHWSEWPMGADMCEWRQSAAALVAHLRGPR